LIIDKVNELLWLRQLRIKFDASKEIKVNDA